MKMVPRILAVAVGATLVAGCETTHYFVQPTSLSNGESLITDAKSRVIIGFPEASENDKKSAAKKSRIVCAEPSPDVAQAIAEALKFGLQLDLSKAAGAATDPSQSKTLGFDFSKSTTASIAQLGERLAVIQLLRDKMYRACEAYANDAIGEASYTLMLARHDKTMMSLLSNELAAGAFSRALTVIGSSASTGGADAEVLKKQQEEVVKKANTLKAVDATNKEGVDKAVKDLQAEVDKLIALERIGYTSASAQTIQGSLGQINGLTRTVNLETIAGMHQNYIDDDGIDPLTDACIIGMDRAPRKQTTDEAKSKIVKTLELMAGIVKQITEVKKTLNEYDKKSEDISEQLKGSPDKPLSQQDEEQQRLNADLQAIERKRQASTDKLRQLEKDKEAQALTLGEIYVANGSPFAAFCYQNVLSSGSQYVSQRMKQKRQLRGLEPTEGTLIAKKLDLCEKALSADDKTMKPETRAEILAACKKPLLEANDNQSTLGKKLDFCSSLMLADDKKLGPTKKQFMPMCQALLTSEHPTEKAATGATASR